MRQGASQEESSVVLDSTEKLSKKASTGVSQLSQCQSHRYLLSACCVPSSVPSSREADEIKHRGLSRWGGDREIFR